VKKNRRRDVIRNVSDKTKRTAGCFGQVDGENVSFNDFDIRQRRVPDAKALQNLWVSGGETARGGRGRGRGGDLAGPAVTATVTPRGGGSVQGRLVFIDDFEIKIVDESGALRSFAREGAVPRVVIDDPLSTHKELLSALTDTAMRDVTAYLVTLK